MTSKFHTTSITPIEGINFELRVFSEGKNHTEDYAWCGIVKELDPKEIEPILGFLPEPRKDIEIRLAFIAPTAEIRRAIGCDLSNMGYLRWYRRTGKGSLRGPFKIHCNNYDADVDK